MCNGLYYCDIGFVSHALAFSCWFSMCLISF